MVAEELFCFISDDLEHDTEFRFEMQRKLVQILKKVPIITEVDFFHGKSPCDGINGTVKRLTARASLQRPYSDEIVDVSSMLAFCKTNIPGIQFCYISIERMKEV